MHQPIQIAMQLHQAGRLPEAEKIYREILSSQSDHVDALYLLGTLAIQMGRPGEAVDLLRRAIQFNPNFADAHANLGTALVSIGQFEGAIAAFRQAAGLKPGVAEMQINLGKALKSIGRIDESAAAFREATGLKPNDAMAHANLGEALNLLERFDEAIAAYRNAIELKPDYFEAHNNLGNALLKTGQSDQAIAAYREAIRLKPDCAEACHGLGHAFQIGGRLDDAIPHFQQAIRLKPDYPDALLNLGIGLCDMGKFDEAIACYRQAISNQPDYAEAFNNLGTALSGKGEYDQAIASYRQAISLKGDYAKAHNNLGNAFKDTGQLDEAIASYRQTIRLKPDYAEGHSNLVFALNYQPDRDAEEILAEHLTWSDRHAHPLMGEMTRHSNERTPDRRLRIGYVSADFRRHSVGHFLIPLLENHDRRILEVFCYANVMRPDDMTERMKRSSDVWRNIVGMPDDAVAKMIRSDGIDILVDLSGHTSGNRLRVFARKPAPIEVTYLGYANTTGMKAIDYRLTDALTDPPGMTDHLNAEKLWRLPGCAWCFLPPENAPDIHPRGNGPITFGCFNVLAKINSNLISIWADLLKCVPESRLLLKSAGAGEASSRERLTAQFAEHGVSGERIELLGWVDRPRRHLELYNEVDVALDTYPYHGTTTTCEAIWMGVPVVSVAGPTHVSRVGVSLLNCVGLPELVARTAGEYVSIAAGLARDLPRMAELRGTLRPRMRASPLTDGTRFARDIETAYREMWRTWCMAGENSGL